MRIVLRRLAQARAFALGLAVLVLVTAFVAALGPLVLGRASDTTLQQAIAAAPVDVRNLQLLVRGRIWPTGGDPLGTVTATGEELEARVPTSVRDLVAERD